MEACCDTISKICISIIQLVTEACCELKVKYIVMLKIKYTMWHLAHGASMLYDLK